jgi:hypothetical protein
MHCYPQPSVPAACQSGAGDLKRAVASRVRTSGGSACEHSSR